MHEFVELMKEWPYYHIEELYTNFLFLNPH